MISIYCDEDVDVLIKPLLAAKGFIVLTTPEEKMTGASDGQQIAHAVQKVCVFLTHNRVHFEQIYAEMISQGKEHHGIIIATRRNVYEIARRVSRILSQFDKDRLRNQLLFI